MMRPTREFTGEQAARAGAGGWQIDREEGRAEPPRYFIDTGRGLAPAAPARIVAYPEGHGEWTIHAEDANGSSIRDWQGDYPFAIWHCAENDCEPISEEQAVALGVGLRRTMQMPRLPIYVENSGALAPRA